MTGDGGKGRPADGLDAAGLEATVAVFGGQATGLFQALVRDLADESADLLSHAELEDLIAIRGREVMRALLQDHLDMRSIREPRLKEVMGSDAMARRNVEPGHARLLVTVFGTARIDRIAYRAIGAFNLYPMDAGLNLPAERSAHGLRRLAAIEAVRGSFDDAKAAIERATGTKVGKRQIEQLAVRASVDVEAFYRARIPVLCTDDTPLVLSFDGKGIVMRPEDLRADTRKAAEAKGGSKMKARLAAGEKLGRKRMAMIGALYDADPVPRTVEDVIIPDGDPDRPRNPGPKAFNKWLVGLVTDNTQTVISTVFDQAEQRDPRHARPWVVLVDGAKAQIEQIRTEAEIRGVTVHIVVDVIHVLEYLWKATWCLHPAGDHAAAETWVTGHARTILAGKVHQTVADLRLEAKTAGLGEDNLETIDKVCGYLENKSPYLRYDTALE